MRSALSIVKSAKISLANIFKVEYNQGNLFYYLGSPSMMRPRTATIGSVSFQVNKKRSHQENPANDGENTPPTRKTSLFDSFRPRSKSDATRKLSHRRVPIVSRNFYLENPMIIGMFSVPTGPRKFSLAVKCIAIKRSFCQS